MDAFTLFDWLARWMATRVLGMSLESHLGASLHFFYFDVPKVMPLLLVLGLATARGLGRRIAEVALLLNRRPA